MLMNRSYLLCCLFPQGWKEPHCFLGGHTNLFITARTNQSQHHLKGGTRALNKYLKSVEKPVTKSIYSFSVLPGCNQLGLSGAPSSLITHGDGRERERKTILLTKHTLTNHSLVDQLRKAPKNNDSRVRCPSIRSDGKGFKEAGINYQQQGDY